MIEKIAVAMLCGLLLIAGATSANGQASSQLKQPPAKPKDVPRQSGKTPVAIGNSEASGKAMKIANDAIASLKKSEDSDAILDSLRRELVTLSESADPVADVEAFYLIARAQRIVGLVCATEDKEARAALLRCLDQSPGFMTELAFALDAKDKLPGVASIAAKLEKTEGKKLEAFATLGAAICVVYDTPLVEQVNENKVVADDPVRLFEYFVTNESRMPLGLRKVPPQLLVLVVSTTAKVNELGWALTRYKGDRDIGKRFFEIKYDMSHYLNGTPKVVTKKGLTLPNLLEFGGVCADQAYFAANVAKAEGIPSAVMHGRSAEVSHAWVAYLTWDQKEAVFETKQGRYPEYRAVLGYINDPQTGQQVAEASLALRAAMALTPVEKRQRATALEDAGYLYLRNLVPPSDVKAADDQTKEMQAKLTPDQVAKLLAISEGAANLSPGSARAWNLGVTVGVTGSWSKEQRNRWGEAIFQTLGDKYGSFALDALVRVISSVEDHAEQNELWNWLFRACMHNGDMASIARFNQAAMFEHDQQPDKAWECYSWILKLYADTSPKAVEAAKRVIALLKRNGKSMGAGVEILRDAWAKTTPPISANPGFAKQSNWSQIGYLYAISLREAGRMQEAEAIATALGLTNGSQK